MGIIKNGILGTVVNKVGAVVGKKIRGQNVITGISRGSNKRESSDQLEQQFRFGLLSRFLMTHGGLIESGFKRKARQQSAMTTAYHYNYPNAFLVQEKIAGESEKPLSERIKLDYAALCYSVGPIQGPNCGRVVRNADATCTFSWLDYPQSRDSQNTDRAGCLIWDASTGRAYYLVDVGLRGSLGFDVDISFLPTDVELHFYMHFINASTKV